MGTKYYNYETIYGAGPVFYQEPSSPGAITVFLGDPGVGEAPRRNAPVWMGWEVSLFPKKPARLIYFWWGNGGGRISPFIERMMRIWEIYDPVFIGIDSTGTQKNMAVLINEYIEQRKKIDEKDVFVYDEVLDRNDIPQIHGLDFSGTKKITYLHACRLFVEGKLFSWPKGLVGIRSQLSNYDPEKDGKTSNLPQDIVATMGMSAHTIRGLFNVDPADFIHEILPADQEALGRDANRRTEEERSKRNTAAREPVYD